MKKLLILCFFAVVALSISDSRPPVASNFGARFNLAFPQGEFKTFVDNVGYGVDLDMCFSVVPFVHLGIGGGIIIYGKETRREPFSYTISRVFVDVTTTNQIGYLHLVGRVSPEFNFLNPYIEGRAGGASIWTDTKIESEAFGDNNVIAESKNFQDYAWNAGFGGGLHIRVSTLKDNAGWVFLDLKTLYIFGTNAEYLTEGAIDDSHDDVRVTYYVSKSRTSLLQFQVGLNFWFR